MINQRASSADRFPGQHVRSGMAKDKLIFVIICSAALLVAAIAVIHFFRGSSRDHLKTSSWQCLNCKYEFSNTSLSEIGPIECPKCGGEAVSALYRNCPSCGERVALSRLRLTETGKAQWAAMKKRTEAAGQRLRVQPGGSPLDVEEQYRVKQADGSYDWTEWISAYSSQLIAELKRNMRCSECGAPLFQKGSRSGGARD